MEEQAAGLVESARRDGPYLVVALDGFTVRFLLGDDDPALTENGDAHVVMADGTTRSVTFLTPRAIQRVLDRWHDTGEAGRGSYFWAADMVVIPRPGIQAVVSAVAELVRSGEIRAACQVLTGHHDEAALTGADLDQIEHRAMLATRGPWEPRLETRWGTGGASCIDLNPGRDEDNELFLTYAPDNRVSPDTQLDADVDFIAHARTDVPKLVAEVRRLRAHRDQDPIVSA
ncbi:hypothetical protein [Phytohabitans aurantiacus]|uniref:hypothetical protein n=1 Tax=Phytohabitans aurantiacus TaxID=3016789 RepID=UPI002490DEC7|nr:hypothetical protein [Phytohabitans aurantiacus]